MSRPPTPGPQTILRVNTHSRCKGEGGHGELYHRDDWMRPGRQDERGLRAEGGRNEATRDSAVDAGGDAVVLHAGTGARRDGGGRALALGERPADGSRAPRDGGERA